jgi:hypothetical protein
VGFVAHDTGVFQQGLYMVLERGASRKHVLKTGRNIFNCSKNRCMDYAWEAVVKAETENKECGV